MAKANIAADLQLDIDTERTCDCKPSHICCLSAKEWLKNQLGVWEFNYEKRDIRDKSVHPATYPIALARRVIEQFTHVGEMVLDPFVGSGSSLIVAMDVDRNAVGFDLFADYVALCQRRLQNSRGLFPKTTTQLALQDDARNIRRYLQKESVSLIVTSPPMQICSTGNGKTSQGGIEITTNSGKWNSILKTNAI